ncbi:MAG TPA: Mov34/MPN/PAD-1 family protein [Smithella sp.]|nr:Mov34/MPN/PAD-1 family protein [Smithella sp.]
MQLILSEKAYRSIITECRSVDGTETGGILIGKKIDDQRIVVPFSLGPGLKARKSSYRFSPDVQWQQSRLDKIYQLFGIDFIGAYHRHLGHDGQPSNIDFKTARKITSDPGWNVSEAVFPIVTVVGKKINFYPYHLSRTSKRFCLIEWQVVANNDQLIKSTLKRRYNQ